MKSWMRGVALIVATLGIAACGGPVVEEETATDVAATEQELRQCDAQGRCPVNNVCRSGVCYPCKTYPQYCGVELP